MAAAATGCHVEARAAQTKIRKWDVCAGHALLAAAGGKMTAWDGSALEFSIGGDDSFVGGIIATAPGADHAAVVAALADRRGTLAARAPRAQ